MKLSEVFNHLTYGELSQIAIGQNEMGEIAEDNYPVLLSHINLGLTALYKRFNLKEGSVTIPLVSNTTLYPLDGKVVHKIERVATVEGTDLGLNDRSDEFACSTPNMHTLRVPSAIVERSVDLPDRFKTNELLVTYRANHPNLVLVNEYIDPNITEVELPYSHLEALLYFIASRVNNPIGLVNEFNAGNNWASKYELECQQLELQNLEIDQGSTNDRLSKGGWV